MKFLVDAQLPRRLAITLRDQGHDILHTLDLPDSNRTSDKRINEISVAENRVVITKDADFVNSFLLSAIPYKLWLVSTGNIGNEELCNLILKNLPQVITAFENYAYIEMTRTSLVEHM